MDKTKCTSANKEKQASLELINAGREKYDRIKDMRINKSTIYSQINHFNEEANEYDRKMQVVTGLDKCYMAIEEPDFVYITNCDYCYCSCCIVRKQILEMISINRSNGETDNVIYDLNGNRLIVVMIDSIPIVKKRDNKMYIVVGSKVKGFNCFYPVDDIFKSFYYLTETN